jgi:hypothetical protein
VAPYLSIDWGYHIYILYYLDIRHPLEPKISPNNLPKKESKENNYLKPSKYVEESAKSLEA